MLANKMKTRPCPHHRNRFRNSRRKRLARRGADGANDTRIFGKRSASSAVSKRKQSPAEQRLRSYPRTWKELQRNGPGFLLDTGASTCPPSVLSRGTARAAKHSAARERVSREARTHPPERPRSAPARCVPGKAEARPEAAMPTSAGARALAPGAHDGRSHRGTKQRPFPQGGPGILGEPSLT